MANELWIYDFIGKGFFEDGVTAEGVRDELAGMDKKQRLSVRINSPGGDVFEAVAIRTQLAQWPGGVDVKVDGLAASAASYIATVGETVSIADGGMLMIHDPWTVAIGNAEDMNKAASMLDKVAEGLVSAYAAKSGKSDEEVRAVMKAETWMTAKEAIEFGLANNSVEAVVAAFQIPETFGFKNAPCVSKAKPRPLSRSAAMKRQIERAKNGIAPAY